MRKILFLAAVALAACTSTDPTQSLGDHIAALEDVSVYPLKSDQIMISMYKSFADVKSGDIAAAKAQLGLIGEIKRLGLREMKTIKADPALPFASPDYRKYGNLANAYPSYISGLIYMLTADGMPDKERAVSHIKTAYTLSRSRRALKTDYELSEQLIRGEASLRWLKPTVWIFIESGKGVELKYDKSPIVETKKYTKFHALDHKMRNVQSEPLADLDSVFLAEFVKRYSQFDSTFKHIEGLPKEVSIIRMTIPDSKEVKLFREDKSEEMVTFTVPGNKFVFAVVNADTGAVEIIALP